MGSSRDTIHNIIRGALKEVHPEVVGRIAELVAANSDAPLACDIRSGRGRARRVRGFFNKRLVTSTDAAMTFDLNVILACYNALRAVAYKRGGVADVQEFYDRGEPLVRLAFAETTDRVIAYVPTD